MALDPDMLDTHKTAHLVFADGSEYRGFVRDGVIDGLGMLFDAADNEVYVGEYRNGLKSGYGSYNYSDGSKYYGDWSNDTMEGKGTMEYPDGSKYKGRWRKGKRHGTGEMTYSDGTTHIGEWLDDIEVVPKN